MLIWFSGKNHKRFATAVFDVAGKLNITVARQLRIEKNQVYRRVAEDLVCFFFVARLITKAGVIKMANLEGKLRTFQGVMIDD